MKVLVTTAAQMLMAPDGSVWVKSVYNYDFFRRYLSVFDEVKVVTRIKQIKLEDSVGLLRADGPNVEFFALPFYRGPWEYAKVMSDIRNKLYEAFRECDCAVLRIPDEVSFNLFKIAQKKHIPCGIEVVSDCWDFFAPKTMNTILRPILRIKWHVSQKKACRNANGVAYVTEHYIQKRYPSCIEQGDSRFETHYTSADLSSNYYLSARDENDFSKDVPMLLHIGGINNYAKGHFELLNAVALLKSKGLIVNITFIGGGLLLNNLKNVSVKLGIYNQVSFTDQLSNRNDILNIMKKSDLFVFPTMTEGLPRVLLEAMAAGLPCIATNVGGIPELLPENCILTDRSPEAIADKIQEFLTDRSLLADCSIINFTTAQKFSYEKTQKRREKFYRKLRVSAEVD